jgi:hypothetical protein
MMARDLSRGDRGFKKYCISDKMDGEKYEEEVRNVGSEHQTGNGSCEDTEAEA